MDAIDVINKYIVQGYLNSSELIELIKLKRSVC
jgi:hypothetical protein